MVEIYNRYEMKVIIDDTAAAAAVEPQQQPQQIVKNYVAVAKPRDQVIDRRYIDM